MTAPTIPSSPCDYCGEPVTFSADKGWRLWHLKDKPPDEVRLLCGPCRAGKPAKKREAVMLAWMLSSLLFIPACAARGDFADTGSSGTTRPQTQATPAAATPESTSPTAWSALRPLIMAVVESAERGKPVAMAVADALVREWRKLREGSAPATEAEVDAALRDLREQYGVDSPEANAVKQRAAAAEKELPPK